MDQPYIAKPIKDIKIMETIGFGNVSLNGNTELSNILRKLCDVDEVISNYNNKYDGSNPAAIIDLEDYYIISSAFNGEIRNIVIKK